MTTNPEDGTASFIENKSLNYIKLVSGFNSLPILNKLNELIGMEMDGIILSFSPKMKLTFKDNSLSVQFILDRISKMLDLILTYHYLLTRLYLLKSKSICRRAHISVYK